MHEIFIIIEDTFTRITWLMSHFFVEMFERVRYRCEGIVVRCREQGTEESYVATRG